MMRQRPIDCRLLSNKPAAGNGRGVPRDIATSSQSAESRRILRPTRGPAEAPQPIYNRTALYGLHVSNRVITGQVCPSARSLPDPCPRPGFEAVGFLWSRRSLREVAWNGSEAATHTGYSPVSAGRTLEEIKSRIFRRHSRQDGKDSLACGSSDTSAEKVPLPLQGERSLDNSTLHDFGRRSPPGRTQHIGICSASGRAVGGGWAQNALTLNKIRHPLGQRIRGLGSDEESLRL